MSTRIVSASSNADLEEKLDALDMDEFVVGVGMDRGHYIAVVHEEETTFIDNLQDRLDDYEAFAEEVASILANRELDNITKLAQLDMVMAEADDRDLLPDRFSDEEVVDRG